VTIAALVLLGLVIAGFLLYVRDEREAHARLLAGFAREWEKERAELITRIQHPQVMPIRRGAAAARPQRPTDAAALAQVGTFAPRGDGDDTAA
jgi:hypothetical protein